MSVRKLLEHNHGKEKHGTQNGHHVGPQTVGEQILQTKTNGTQTLHHHCKQKQYTNTVIMSVNKLFWRKCHKENERPWKGEA